MRVEKDFVELLELLKENNVKFCIIGAFAVAFHAIARYTKDMDILVEPSVDNGRKIINALKKFGFKDINLVPEDFIQKDDIVQIGYEPVRVDFVNFMEGASFKDVWKNKVKGRYGDKDVFFIGLDDLIKNKRKAGRKIDEADIEMLLKARKMKASGK